MTLVIGVPLVLVIGTHEPKAVITISVVQISLFFVDFWFQFARRVDSTFFDALYGWSWGWDRPHSNFYLGLGLNNAFGDMPLDFVMATMSLGAAHGRLQVRSATS